MPMIDSDTLKYGLSLVAPAEEALDEAVRILSAGPEDRAAAIAAVDAARADYHSACVRLHGYVLSAVVRAELEAQNPAE